MRIPGINLPGTHRLMRTVGWVVPSLLLFGGFGLKGGAESLRDAATNYPGLVIGAAVKPPGSQESAYGNTLRLHLAASPENATKWAAIRPDRYTYRWSDADAISRFAGAGGQPFRGHTLLWHNSIPAWLTGGAFNEQEIRDILFHHIDIVVGRYRGQAWCWDVVNEAFLEDGTVRDSFWHNQPGFGFAGQGTRFIEEVFKRAALADPGARLIYNDYGIETDTTKADAVYAMAQDFLNRGVPLHGIGFQMHISGINSEGLRRNLRRFNDLGLEIHLTEMDVRVPIDAGGNSTEAVLEQQAEIYWTVAGVALGQTRLKALQTWGFTDKDSWIPGFFPGYGNALPFDKNYAKKPAYWALWNVLANQAEKMAVLDFSTGDSTNVFLQETLSGGAGMQLQANGSGDFMVLRATVPQPGPCTVRVGFRRSGASGIFRVSSAPPGSGSFLDLSGDIDAYNSLIDASNVDLGTNHFAAAGDWQFKFQIAGKHPQASDCNLTVDYIRITPAGSNSYPSITSITDKITQQNSTAGPFSFTVGDAESSAGALGLSAHSFNPDLLPQEGIVLSGTGASRNVTLTPASNKSGLAAVMLLVSDGTNQTPETFNLEVVPVNTPPITRGTNVSVMMNDWADVDLASLAEDVETPGSQLQFRVVSANGGTAEMRPDGSTVRFTTANDYFGPAFFTFAVADRGPDFRLLACYDFEPPEAASDNNIADSGLNKLNATLHKIGSGAATLDADVPGDLAGLSGGSLALTESGPGNAARLEVSLPSSIYNLANADWTFACWFKRISSANDDFLFHIGSGDGFGGDGDELDLYLNQTGQLQLRHWNNSNAQDVNLVSGAIALDQWHHCAATFSRTANQAGVLKLFLDGTQVGSSQVAWALDQTAELIFGGVRKGNESRWLNGKLDEVALYRAALTPGEIALLAGGRSVAQLGTTESTNVVNIAVQAMNSAPVFEAAEDLTVIAGTPFSFLAGATDPDVPAQQLRYTLLSAPPGAGIDPANGLVTWRPGVAQAGTTGLFQVVASEAGWTTNLQPVADAYVRDGTYANDNFGADPILTVKRDPTAGFSRETFLRFDLPTLPGRASMAQFQIHPGTANVASTHALAVVTNVWQESAITWNTKPDSTATVATWLPKAGVPVTIDVAEAVRQSANPERTISFRMSATGSTSDGRVDYLSRESAAAPPQLLLHYTNFVPLSVTQTFQIKVIAPEAPVFTDPGVNSGTFSFSVFGSGGPDYIVQASTNLVDWETVLVTNGPPGPFSFGISDPAQTTQRFYKVELGP